MKQNVWKAMSAKKIFAVVLYIAEVILHPTYINFLFNFLEFNELKWEIKFTIDVYRRIPFLKKTLLIVSLLDFGLSITQP